MNIYPPRLESRVSALERQQTMHTASILEQSEDMTASFKQLDTRIEALSEDMTASFKQLADYQIQTEQKIDARFDKIEGDIAGLKEDVTTIKATMATKEDLASLEGRVEARIAIMEDRMFDAFKQLIATMGTSKGE